MISRYISAQSAIDNARNALNGTVTGSQTEFTCPYNDCRTFAVQHWGNLGSICVYTSGIPEYRDKGTIPPVAFSKCEACKKEAIYIGGQLVLPNETDAPFPADDLPMDCMQDYEEARSILPKSPRGAAALLRLVIQKLLPHLGATKTSISDAIGELVLAGKIKTQIQQALDIVRIIGNESVHPGEMNLRDDRETALALFKIVNHIVETEITEPKRQKAFYASLPQAKLKGIENRDAPKLGCK